MALFCIAALIGCSSPSTSAHGPLGENLSVNTACTPARGRASVSLAEILTNDSSSRITVTEVRATKVTNIKVDRSGVRSGRATELPIISGNPGKGTLDTFTDSAIVAPNTPFEYVVVGHVTDPKKDVVVHGFTVRYRVGASAFELRTPSTLTFAAGACS